jgi:hypothetical protein
MNDLADEGRSGTLADARAFALQFALDDGMSMSNPSLIGPQTYHSKHPDDDDSSHHTDIPAPTQEPEWSQSEIERAHNPALQGSRNYALAVALTGAGESTVNGEDVQAKVDDQKENSFYTTVQPGERRPPPPKTLYKNQMDKDGIEKQKNNYTTTNNSKGPVPGKMEDHCSKAHPSYSQTKLSPPRSTSYAESPTSLPTAAETSSEDLSKPDHMSRIARMSPTGNVVVQSQSVQSTMPIYNTADNHNPNDPGTFMTELGTSQFNITGGTVEAAPQGADTTLTDEQSHQSLVGFVAKPSKEGQSTLRRCWVCLAALVIVCAVVVGVVVATSKSSDTEAFVPEPVVSQTESSELPMDAKLAVVPADICMEQVPGQGWGVLCGAEDTIQQGGGACNLVAQAFLDQVPTADIAIQNSGACLTDIERGDFKKEDAYQLLPHTHTLVTVEVTGAEIVLVLEQALQTVFGKMERFDGGYPYAAGLRFNVNATAEFMNRLSYVQVNERLEESSWSPIGLNETYTVLANSFIVAGGDGYEAFRSLPDSRIFDTEKDATETFVDYALDQAILQDPRRSEYSTQSFIP